MRPKLLLRALGSIAATLVCFAPAFAASRPEHDALTASASARSVASVLNRLQSEAAARRLGTVASVDERLELPTFVWAGRTGADPSPSDRPRTAERAARDHLERTASLYRLAPADARGAVLRRVHDTGRGGVIASFVQEVEGIEVFRDEIKVLMNRVLDPIAISGYVPSSDLAPRDVARAFRLGEHAAIAAALVDFGSTRGVPIHSTGPAPGGYETFAAAGTALQPVRVKKVLFHLPGALEPGYYLELMSEAEAYSYVISAVDGRLLFRHDLVADDAYGYRVWADASAPNAPFDGPAGTAPSPHPTGTPDQYEPPFVATSLVTVPHGPISTLDPWLPPGSTETVGNNIDAYADLVAPDGRGAGDFRASITSPGVFDRAYDPDLPPASSVGQQMAAITQLFYVNNYLHDLFYDAGFDEASGNAQASNYGRGGIEGDRIRAEGQDYSGTNNANMATPADGGAPRMQMYVFRHPSVPSLTVLSPGAIAGDYETATNDLGASSFDLTGDLMLANDGVGNPADACETIVGALTGKIALIDLGNCQAADKLTRTQSAGAVGAIIAHDIAGAPPPELFGGQVVSIPVLTVTYETGVALKAHLPGPVTVRMLSQAQLTRDGTIDNQIIAHEWGHYMSHRLIGNGNGLNTAQAGAMNEGWSDFHALLLTVRPEDATAPGGSGFSGAYPVGSYAQSSALVRHDKYYFGIRRYPYSTDLSRNPLTFRHIERFVPLPAGPPVAFGADGSANHLVHRAGEVWCNTLWECYAALLRDDARLTFDEARRRMREYLVAGQKMTPASPTMTEARDGILSVVQAADTADFRLFCEAFARRGFGTGALSPDRSDPNNIGVVESFSCGGALAFEEARLDDDLSSCDSDDYLDAGETGSLRVTLDNVGAVHLTATSATVSSTHPNVSFPNGNTLSFPASAPFSSTIGSLPVSLSGVVGVAALDFQIQYDDPDLLAPGPYSANVTLHGNADEVPASIETVEAMDPPWTTNETLTGETRPWRRVPVGPGQHRFAVTTPVAPSEQRLVTPPLQVAATGNFTFTFSHAHAFEAGGGLRFDGGVIEISDDGGASWIDIGASATPGYGGVIYNSGNPLAGRQAYTGTSPGYPATQAVSVNLGNAWAGQTVLVRFLAAADNTIASSWEIDDIAFHNLTHLPFRALVPDTSECTPVAVGNGRSREWSFTVAGAHPIVERAGFRFALPERSRVRLAIYDVAGRRMATLASGEFAAGEHGAEWNPSAGAAKAGVYFARLEMGGRSFMRRLVVTH